MDYKDLYDAVDRMDDFTNDYYNTKEDNKYLNAENKVLKDDNDTLVLGIRDLNRVARRRYPQNENTQNQRSCCDANNQTNNNTQIKPCCLLNFNFKNVIIGVGVLFLMFLACGVTPDTTISWASTKEMWIEFICDP